MAKTLSEHAAYELTLSGLTEHTDPEAKQTAVNTMALIRRLEKQNNNERQKEFLMTALQRLLNGEALSPLTDNPEEWEEFEITKRSMAGDMKVQKHKIWQSLRDKNMVSYDEGKTYIDQTTGKQHDTISSEEAEQRRQELINFKKPVEGAPGVPANEMAPDMPAGAPTTEGTNNTGTATEAMAEAEAGQSKE